MKKINTPATYFPLKNIGNLFYLLVGMIIMASCKDNTPIPKGTLDGSDKIYIPAAGKISTPVTLKMKDSVQAFTIGATYGALGSPDKDISVKLEANPSMVATFNAANATNYPLLPADSYTFNGNTVIPKGGLNTELLQIKVNPNNKLTLFKEYLLPISITQVSDGIKINENLRTAYYVVKASLAFSDFKDISRANWSILAVSDQEPAEGPTNGGVGPSAIDNNLVSFWHSKWDGGNLPLPHWIAIDMGQPTTLHGIILTGRQSDNQGKPKNIDVTISADGQTWEEAGSISFENNNTRQKFFIMNIKQTRYFKLTVTSTHGSVPYTHMAEIEAF